MNNYLCGLCVFVFSENLELIILRTVQASNADALVPLYLWSKAMNGRVALYRLTAVVLMILLFNPVVLAESGGKYFKQGRKFEVAEQWELAAEQYALALNQDPGNPEFRLHL